jgi:hypothetical protein
VPQPVHYIPVITTIFALIFSVMVFRRYQEKGKGTHLLWWSAGIFIYGVGTFTEGFVTLFGWGESIFRAWYISGALLGGMPLAQGTVYLLLRRKTANILTGFVVPYFVIASICIMMAPIDLSLVEPHRLSGSVIAEDWQWVRGFSPFINLYALIFLAGGAAYSAYRFKKSPKTYHRYVGNVFIAVGALLPGIGGSFTRYGYVEVLYVTELLGLSCIYLGYKYNIQHKVISRDEIELAEEIAQEQPVG